MILLKAALITAAFAAIGYFLKIIIWRGARPATGPIEYGRKLASYSAFIASVSSMHFFSRNDVTEAAIKFGTVFIALVLAAFAAGAVYGLVKKKNQKNTEVGKDFKNFTDDQIPHSATLGNGGGTKPAAASVLVTVGFLVAAIGFAIVVSDGTKHADTKSKWIPILKAPKIYYDTVIDEDMYLWIDEGSVHKKDGRLYGFIGEDNAVRDEDGGLFDLFKVEVDCDLLRYRKIERSIYSERMSKGLGQLIKEDRDYVKTYSLTVMKNSPNLPLNGGWISKKSAVEFLKRIDVVGEGSKDRFAFLTKSNIAVVDFFCAK